MNAVSRSCQSSLSDDAFAPRGKLIKGNFDFINISVYMNVYLKYMKLKFFFQSMNELMNMTNEINFSNLVDFASFQ